MSSGNSKTKHLASSSPSLLKTDASTSLIRNNISDTNGINTKKKSSNSKHHRVTTSSSPTSTKSSPASSSQNLTISSQIPTSRPSIALDAKVTTSSISGMTIVKTQRKQDSERMMSSPPVRQILMNGNRKIGNKAASSINNDSNGIKSSFSSKISGNSRSIPGRSTSNPAIARSSPPASTPSIKSGTPYNTLKADTSNVRKTPGSPLGSKADILKQPVTTPKRRYTPKKSKKPSKITKISIIDTSISITTASAITTLKESTTEVENLDIAISSIVENLHSDIAPVASSLSDMPDLSGSSSSSTINAMLDDCSNLSTPDPDEARFAAILQNETLAPINGIDNQASEAAENMSAAFELPASAPLDEDERITGIKNVIGDESVKEHGKPSSEVSFASEASVD